MGIDNISLPHAIPLTFYLSYHAEHVLEVITFDCWSFPEESTAIVSHVQSSFLATFDETANVQIPILFCGVEIIPQRVINPLVRNPLVRNLCEHDVVTLSCVIFERFRHCLPLNYNKCKPHTKS